VNPRKRIIIIAVSILAAIAIVAGFLYWRGWHGKTPGVVTKVTLADGPYHVGTPIQLTLDIELPWSRKLYGDAQVALPDGLEQSEDEYREESLGFGVRKTRIQLFLLAYEYGPFENVEVQLFAEPDRDGGGDRLVATLPTITISPREDIDEEVLALADEIPSSYLASLRERPWWFFLLAFLAVAVLTVVLTRLLKPKREQRRPPPVPPWTVAESAIHRLRGQLPLPADEVFVELTDIIRRYIEAVYNIRATETTTPEFLREINREGSELFTEHRLLLADFLTAADMVKFARLDTSQSQIEDTIKRAMKFIVETSDSLRRQAEVERQFASVGGKA
jgi:hypothetical protein